MITALIIDDEEKGILVLSKLIKMTDQQIKVIGTANSLENGINEINQKKPQLVFLDIHLGDGNGFDLLEQTDFKNFEVIFTTAFNNYALQAIKASAIDYLMKPIILEELSNAIEKVTKQINNTPSNSKSDKLIVPVKNSIRFININDILFIEGDGNYSKVNLLNGESFQSTKSIKKFEDSLNNSIFYRVHKSYIVNLNYIAEIDSNNFLKLVSGDKVELSRRKKAEFLKSFQKL